MTRRLYLEDLKVGDVFGSGTHSVASEDIKRFAAEFDPQPFHLDEADAARSFFAGLAASGWHTAAMTMRLIVDSLPIAGGVIGARIDELRWPKPVRPGDILRLESEVLELRPSESRPERGFARIRTTTIDQHGEPVQVLVSNIVLQRRVTQKSDPTAGPGEDGRRSFL